MFGLCLVLFLASFAVLAPLLVGHEPNASDFSLPRSAIGGPPPPSPAHLLGADPLFRDVLARLAAGARLSLGIAVAATTLALALGSALGLLAGMAEGTRYRAIDRAALGVIDLALAFPYLLLVTAVGVALDRAGAVVIALILGGTSWVGIARLMRARTLEIKRRDYVLAASALGVPVGGIVRRHILPGLRGPLLVLGSQAVGQMVLAESVLSYLTVGVGPPQASWGRMLQEAEHYLGAQPLLVGAPAFAILLTVFGFSRVADGIAEALEPRRIIARSRVPADILVLAALLALLVGFSGVESLEAPLPNRVHEDRVLRLATSSNVGVLDPALAADEATLSIDELVHARLLRRDERGELTGELAESFRVEDGGATLRLFLREGLTFHDGSPLRSSDVKRSIERALHPSTPCPAASEFAALAGFDEFRAGRASGLSGIELPGEREVVLRLRAPDAAFPSLLGLGFTAPVCPSAAIPFDPSAEAPCGAGPFRLAERDDEHVELRRFEGYHLPAATSLVGGIRWLLAVPFRTQLFRFAQGELDLLTEVSGIDAQRFDADPRWNASRLWADRTAINGVFLNTSIAPFENRHLRRAVAFALDPSVLPRLRPSLAAADRVLPAGIPRPSSAAVRLFDRSRALDEMRLAGYAFDEATGIGGYPVPIDYVTVPASLDQSVAEIYQQQLARVGIRIRIRALSFASFLAATSTQGACAMGWRAWQPDYPDPAAIIDPTLTSSAIAEHGGQNVSFFANAELDALALHARREPDVTRRMSDYAAIEGIVRDEAPWIPTYATRSLVLFHPYVRDLRLTGDGRLDLRAVSLAHADAATEGSAR